MERFLKAGKRLVNLGNTNFIDLGKPNQVVFLMKDHEQVRFSDDAQNYRGGTHTILSTEEFIQLRQAVQCLDLGIIALKSERG